MNSDKRDYLRERNYLEAERTVLSRDEISEVENQEYLEWLLEKCYENQRAA